VAITETLRSLYQRLTPLDRKLLLVLLIGIAGSFLLLLTRQPGARVVAEVAGKTVFVADLQQDQQIELTGPLGTTSLTISAGTARVESSPCPHKTCISAGKIWRDGDLLACVPNRVLVRVEGEKEQERDYDIRSH
jgi:hypothetical protein